MNYRIVREPNNWYSLEQCQGGRNDPDWSWTYIPGGVALTYWGARFQLWRLIRRRAKKPAGASRQDVVYCVRVSG